MNLYTVALVIHLVGACAVFIGIGVWFFAAMALRRAQEVAQVRALTGLTVGSGNVAVGGVLLLAIAGLYMALTTWAWQTAWIDVATASFALLAPLGVLVIDPRIRAMAKVASVAADGPLPEPLLARTRDPLVSLGLSIYLTLLVGIVFAMTTKPMLAVAIAAMVVAAAVGVLLGWLVQRAAHPPRSPEKRGGAAG